jgi:hypothetical protein
VNQVQVGVQQGEQAQEGEGVEDAEEVRLLDLDDDSDGDETDGGEPTDLLVDPTDMHEGFEYQGEGFDGAVGFDGSEVFDGGGEEEEEGKESDEDDEDDMASFPCFNRASVNGQRETNGPVGASEIEGGAAGAGASDGDASTPCIPRRSRARVIESDDDEYLSAVESPDMLAGGGTTTSSSSSGSESKKRERDAVDSEDEDEEESLVVRMLRRMQSPSTAAGFSAREAGQPSRGLPPSLVRLSSSSPASAVCTGLLTPASQLACRDGQQGMGLRGILFDISNNGSGV